jgi:hypothetical protein
MAPTKRNKTSANTTTPKKLKSSTHVADPNSVSVYADQSSSRLMALPKEIRNNIYTSVFCDNIDHICESRSHRSLTFSLSSVVHHEREHLHDDKVSVFGRQLLGIEQAILEFVLTTWHPFPYFEVTTPYRVVFCGWKVPRT